MADADFIIKQHDTWPIMGDPDPVVLEHLGGPINLTGATVKLLAQKLDSPLDTIEGTCDIVVAANGTVTYEWAPGDTAVAGDFQFEFQITFGDGKVATVPTEGYKLLKIVGDLGD